MPNGQRRSQNSRHANNRRNQERNAAVMAYEPQNIIQHADTVVIQAEPLNVEQLEDKIKEINNLKMALSQTKANNKKTKNEIKRIIDSCKSYGYMVDSDLTGWRMIQPKDGFRNQELKEIRVELDEVRQALAETCKVIQFLTKSGVVEQKILNGKTEFKTKTIDVMCGQENTASRDVCQLYIQYLEKFISKEIGFKKSAEVFGADEFKHHLQSKCVKEDVMRFCESL
tara:strand:- start:489 stop:1169 length:681 start_codon:yes stop_codon:yes gene_type:complete